MSVKESLQELAQNPKIAAGVSTMTAGTGTGTMLDFIPGDIGKLATLVGIILSVILIRVHLINLKKSKLELEIMKKKEAERLFDIELRRENGKPVRREEDICLSD